MARRRAKSGDPRRAVAYVRTSTDVQDLSPAAQLASIRAWAAREGVEVVAVREDRVSGAAPLEDRPGLLAGIDDLAEHSAGALVVHKRDRLARDVVLAAMIERLCERQGARVLAADGTGNADTPEGQLLRGVVDLFAQFERACIRARTKAALRVKRDRGERVGGVPIGWRLADDGVRLVEDPEGQRAREIAIRSRAEGLTLAAIARRLDDERIATRGGGRWHPQSVANMLRRAA